MATGTITLYDEEVFGGEAITYDLANFPVNQMHSMKDHPPGSDFRDRAESAKWVIEPGFIVILTEREDGMEKQYVCWGTGSCPHFSEYRLGNALKAFRIIDVR